MSLNYFTFFLAEPSIKRNLKSDNNNHTEHHTIKTLERLTGQKMITFTTRTGASVFVGRDAKENDYLTFSFAEKTDIWFHVDAIPGSHVLLRACTGTAATREDIEFAAQKAAMHSKAKGQGKCKVVFCSVMDVAKDKRAKDGLVFLLGDAKHMIVHC